MKTKSNKKSKLKQPKISLSVLSQKTEKLLFIFLLIVLGLLGFLYLFTANNIIIKGYVLQKETKKIENHSVELENLDTIIANQNIQKNLIFNDQVKKMKKFRPIFLNLNSK